MSEITVQVTVFGVDYLVTGEYEPGEQQIIHADPDKSVEGYPETFYGKSAVVHVPSLTQSERPDMTMLVDHIGGWAEFEEAALEVIRKNRRAAN
jgi:20S proteasome alpha/beta subunit